LYSKKGEKSSSSQGEGVGVRVGTGVRVGSGLGVGSDVGVNVGGVGVGDGDAEMVAVEAARVMGTSAWTAGLGVSSVDGWQPDRTTRQIRIIHQWMIAVLLTKVPPCLISAGNADHNR
jgi:hypothetical protein